jgi:hypothetical protein
MKTKDLPVLKQKVLDILPITQAEMWKTLGIPNRDGSTLVTLMLKENLIRRTKQDKSFLLERINGNGGINEDKRSGEEELELKRNGEEELELKRKADEELELKRKGEEELELKRKGEEELELKRKADEEIKAKEELKRKADEELKRNAEEELKVKEELKRNAEEELKRKTQAVEMLVLGGKNQPKDSKYLRQKALEILPIKQSEMWKTLGISSSACARLVDSMLKENLITRKKSNNTFIIEKLDKNKKERKLDFSALLSNKKRFSPCAGCELECDAASCLLLSNWIME